MPVIDVYFGRDKERTAEETDDGVTTKAESYTKSTCIINKQPLDIILNYLLIYSQATAKGFEDAPMFTPRASRARYI